MSQVRTEEAQSGRYFTVGYEPSSAPGRLQLGVAYTLWIPRGVERVRGIIVHQHGCGAGACREYRLVVVNSVGLESAPSDSAKAP